MQVTPIPNKRKFTSYETFVIAILAFIQFTVVLDFMVLSPLSAILLPELSITTSQFGLVVSAYAISAGLSGITAAGFADKYDRKKILIFFYSGFVLGTLLCGIAPNYYFLLGARIVTGIFGGVISSVSFAIITDLFEIEVRGRVMGFVQMAFASSQVLGLPIGLYLANHFGWHAPFLMIVGASMLVGVVMILKLHPVDAHLKLKTEKRAIEHLIHALSKRNYLKAFAATTLLATGGFMMMPFGAAFSVNNLGITLDQLPLVYMLTGIASMIAGPLVGKLSDVVGKYKIFAIGTCLSVVMVLIYCQLGITPLWVVIVINIVLFVGISSRIISSSALITGVPDPHDRGAFMGINSSVQQISGGIASAIAGLIVFQTASGFIEHYEILGFVATGTMLTTILMMYFINKQVQNKKEVPVRNAA